MIAARRIAIAFLAVGTAGTSLRAADDPRLIPKPREVAAGDLAPIAKSVSISGATSDDDRFTAKDLSESLKERGLRVVASAEGTFKIALLRVDSPTGRRVLEDNKITFKD